jgi:flagellar basal-body rod modification protein FlgD
MNIQGISPTMIAPVSAQAAVSSPTAKTTPTTTTTSTTGNGNSATSLQDEFLNLLVTELQNQDPTAPVDPTAMVGQLVSLNQLDQLININSTLTNIDPAAADASSAVQHAISSPLSGSSGSSSNSTSSNPAALAATALNQQQASTLNAVDPSALMNLYGSSAAAAQTSPNTTTGGW